MCKLKYGLQKDSDMPEKDELLLGLKTIGFSDCEARIYLAVLELKEALPSSISKRLKLKRPSVYVILERLEGKGLLHSVKKNGYLRYCIKNPDLFIEEEMKRSATIKSYLENLKSGLSKLHSLHEIKEEKLEVAVFKGTEALKQMKGTIRRFKGKIHQHAYLSNEIIFYGETMALLAGEEGIGVVIQSKEIVKAQQSVLENLQRGL